MNESKKKALISLKKAQTSLGKIVTMVESDEYCADIVVQNLSAIWLIKSSNNKLLEAFIETCQDDTEKKKDDLVHLFRLLQK